MKRLGSSILVCGALILLSAPRPAHAFFHFMVIDEIMTSYDGDPNVQFVELKHLTILQNLVTNTVLGAFDPNGTYLGDVLVVPNNIAPGAADVRWLMATQAFETLFELTPEFIIPSALPTVGGMVCWGAPGAGLMAADPNSWDHSDADLYVDCVAYGTYSGPTNIHSGNPTPLDGDGHSLVRSSITNDNETDFSCGDPAGPENENGQTESLLATTPCPPEPSIPVLPRWGLPLLLGLLTGSSALLLLRRRVGTALTPPPQ